MARHQGVLLAGVGPAWRDDLLASLRSWSSIGHSLPGFESKAPPTVTRRRRDGTVTTLWTSSCCPPSEWALKLGPRRSGSSPLQSSRQPEAAVRLTTNWVKYATLRLCAGVWLADVGRVSRRAPSCTASLVVGLVIMPFVGVCRSFRCAATWAPIPLTTGPCRAVSASLLPVPMPLTTQGTLPWQPSLCKKGTKLPTPCTYRCGIQKRYGISLRKGAR